MTYKEWYDCTDVSKMLAFSNPSLRKCLLFVASCKAHICDRIGESHATAKIEEDIENAGKIPSMWQEYALAYALESIEMMRPFLTDHNIRSDQERQWQAKLLRHMVRPFKE
jgi:hypothetical protein